MNVRMYLFKQTSGWRWSGRWQDTLLNWWTLPVSNSFWRSWLLLGEKTCNTAAIKIVEYDADPRWRCTMWEWISFYWDLKLIPSYIICTRDVCNTGRRPENTEEWHGLQWNHWEEDEVHLSLRFSPGVSTLYDSVIVYYMVGKWNLETYLVTSILKFLAFSSCWWQSCGSLYKAYIFAFQDESVQLPPVWFSGDNICFALGKYYAV